MLDSLLQEMRRNPVLVAALVVFAIYVFVGAAAPVLAPYDPNIQNLRATLAPPTSLNLLGADEYGRDLLSRLIYGTRSSMIVGAAVVVCSALIGLVLGILSGYRGGFLDDLIMRSSDVMMAFPFLVLALGLIAALGAGLGSTIIALTAAFAPIYVRIVRGCVLQIRQEAYVDAARIMGVKPARVALRHVVPNVMGPVLVQGALTFAFAVLAEASLSFVGSEYRRPMPRSGTSSPQGVTTSPKRGGFPPWQGFRSSLSCWRCSSLPTACAMRSIPTSTGSEVGMALLAVHGLRTHIPTRRGVLRAVDGIDLSIDAGEIVGLVGESGCGKDDGRLLHPGARPTPAGGRGRSNPVPGRGPARQEPGAAAAAAWPAVSMVFQEPLTALNPLFPVGTQIRDVLLQHQRLSPRAARARIHELLAHVGFPSPRHVARTYPFQLSGGMRQRVLIAMAIACRPRLVIADEPTTALDTTIQAQILDLLRRLVAEDHIALLSSPTTSASSPRLCQRVYVMYAGEIVEQAPVRDLSPPRFTPIPMRCCAARRRSRTRTGSSRASRHRARHDRAGGPLRICGPLPPRRAPLPVRAPGTAVRRGRPSRCVPPGGDLTFTRPALAGSPAAPVPGSSAS